MKSATFILLDRTHHQFKCTLQVVFLFVPTLLPPPHSVMVSPLTELVIGLVADRGNPSMVVIIDKNNNLINKLATGEGEISHQVAIAPNGDVWVTHSANKILIYSE